MRNSKIQFVRSLGYLDPHGHLYSALMLQPRIVGAVTVIGVLLQTPWLFLALSAALGWSALVPTRSCLTRSTTTWWRVLEVSRR